jgi:16S rRNA (adenine1518-N6/adenine1519-N6)-dimethyltransferase
VSLSRTEVTDLLDRHGLAPSRALGQNFLCDRGTIDKIVRLAGVGPGDGVVEIGPGLGSLTTGLLEAGADVIAVEVDRYLLPALTEVTAPWAEQVGSSGSERLRIVHADAREVDWDDLLDDRPWAVVANLPYNIATPLILDLLVDQPRFARYLVMVQREAGERLTAGPGSRIYGIPSVLVAYWAEARLVGSIRPEVFLPRPKVDSVLVRIDRSPEPRVDADHTRLVELVRAGFGQRRKMLRRSLAGLMDEAAIERAGIDPTSRPEQLSVEDWARLTRTGVDSGTGGRVVTP